MKLIMDKLASTGELPTEELKALLQLNNKPQLYYLCDKADAVRQKQFGDKVCIYGFVQGDKMQILSCVREGYTLGIRAFVLRTAENEENLCSVIGEIKKAYPDCSITLSIGVKGYQSCKAMYDAGADGYFLNFATADCNSDNSLLTLQRQCVEELKYIGYKVGVGIKAGLQQQSAEDVLADLRFLKRVAPDAVVIEALALADMDNLLKFYAILRLMFPKVILPATAALDNVHPKGREMSVCAGADTVCLYIKSGTDNSGRLEVLKKRMSAIGY